MKTLSTIYKEQGIAFDFPIKITNKNGFETYYENEKGYWNRYAYDAADNEIQYANSDGLLIICEYDEFGNETSYKDNDGYWSRNKFDAEGNHISSINSRDSGTPI